MKALKVGIIGYGRSGRDIHTHLFKQLPDMYEVVAVADSDDQRQGMIQNELGCKAFNSYEEFYNCKDLDFVVNASFSHMHSTISKALLNNGLNVLSEKPAANNEKEFISVLETAQATGKKYFVFQQYRFSPSYIKLKDVLASGCLGRIVQIELHFNGFARRWDWQTIQGFNAGSLLNTGPHPVDIALDLMSFPENPKVTCFMDRAQTYGDAEDFVKLLLSAESAPLLEIEISSCNAFSDFTYLVQGTRGTLKGDTKKLDWKYYDESKQPHQELTKIPLRNEKGEPLYCREKLETSTGSWEATGAELDDFNYKGLGFYRSFYEAFTTGKPFMIQNDHVRKQMKVIEQSHLQNDDKLKAFVKM